jgi:hypothetical protein
MRIVSLLLIATMAVLMFAMPASAQVKVGQTFRDEHGRLCTVESVRTLKPGEVSTAPPLVLDAKSAACNCNPCNCQTCQGGCFGPLTNRPPLISVTEQVQLRGRTFGYTLQSQRPFLRVQAGGCANGQCAVPGSILP